MEPDLKLISQIKGFLSESEGRYLYELALQSSRRGPCLEIGSYCGKSTIFLASACRRNNAILFAVDHHGGSEEQQPGQAYFDPELVDPATGKVDTFAEFRKNMALAGLSQHVVPLLCASSVAAKAWATPLSLVFIDGSHDRPSVAADYRLWAPHLIAGGFLVFHDIFEDPRLGGQAPFEVYRTAVESGRFEPLDRRETLGVLRARC